MEHSIPVFPGISNHALYCCTVRFSNHIRHYQAMYIKLCPAGQYQSITIHPYSYRAGSDSHSRNQLAGMESSQRESCRSNQKRITFKI